ncbi:MAG TPA: PAAR domain-containing protein [Bacteroidales bacterium]|nr:PAAR domain-containing protein [Bacteroidales bacterium]
MAKVSRLGDAVTGYCSSGIHGYQDGVIIECSPNVNANGIGVARVGDKVRANCGHIGTIVSGALNTNANGRAIARIGDSFSGTYSGTIVAGSPNVDCE